MGIVINCNEKQTPKLSWLRGINKNDTFHKLPKKKIKKGY